MPFGSEYGILPIFVLVFLLIDLLFELRSLKSLVLNLFFWLYWFAYSVAAETALYLLDRATKTAAAPDGLPRPLLILIAVVGTTTVLQSLTFKVGGKRVIDLSSYLDEYRRTVLSSSAQLVTRFERKRVQNQSRLILKKVN